MNVVQAYQEALRARGFVADAAQQAAVMRLQELSDALDRFRAQRSGLIGRLVRRPAVPRGVWLYGGVGRGKSFLMDCFFGAVPVRRKTRLHFHEFMRAVHRELETLKGQADPLDEVAKRVAHRHRLICFDEFHVSDIADAMILERLMRGLFAHGVCFVMTSNYHPDALYPDGLHRDRIVPAIELIKSQVDVLAVDAGTDYRRMALAQVQAYHQPLDESSADALKDAFERLAEPGETATELHIENRVIHARRRAGGVVWFDFEALCAGPRSQNDYLDIAARFHTVLLSGVPIMPPAMASEARRFVWLIDVLYDQKVKLIMSAAGAPEQLYTQGAMATEFHRTVSRIIEMQSRDYLEAPRRGVAQRLS